MIRLIKEKQNENLSFNQRKNVQKSFLKWLKEDKFSVVDYSWDHYVFCVTVDLQKSKHDIEFLVDICDFASQELDVGYEISDVNDNRQVEICLELNI